MASPLFSRWSERNRVFFGSRNRPVEFASTGIGAVAVLAIARHQMKLVNHDFQLGTLGAGLGLPRNGTASDPQSLPGGLCRGTHWQFPRSD